MLAECNNQPNWQMGYVGECNNLPLNKLIIMVNSRAIVTRQIQSLRYWPYWQYVYITMLKTLAILAVCLYPPVDICSVLKWEMRLTQGL